MSDYDNKFIPRALPNTAHSLLDAVPSRKHSLKVAAKESGAVEKARQFYCRKMKIDAKMCPTLFQLAVGQDSSIRFPAIYLDMDGTALGSDKQLLKETLKALEDYQHRGGWYGIASGRTLEQLLPYLTKLNPDLPIVLYNGGLTLSPKDLQPLSQKNLDPASLSKIIDTMPAIEGVRTVFVHYRDSTIINRQDDGITAYKTKVGIIDTTLCEGAAFAKCVAEKNKKGELPIKVMLYTEWDSANAVAEKAKKALGGAAVVLVGSPETIEVLPQGVDKAIAIRAILPSFHLSANDVVVFGDSGNDARMLTEFPVSMAMGNCQKSACDAAAFKIGPNDQPTIATVIERLVKRSGFQNGPPYKALPPPQQLVEGKEKTSEEKMSANAIALKRMFEKRRASCTYAPAELGEALTCKYTTLRKYSDDANDFRRGQFTLFVEGPTLNDEDHSALVRTKFKPRYDILCNHPEENKGYIACDGAFHAYSFNYESKNDKLYCHGGGVWEEVPKWVWPTTDYFDAECDTYAPYID